MKKRSAMAIAAGIVAALLVGAVSLAAGFSGGETAVASSGSERVEPRVRTIERTITVHKKAKAEAAPAVRTIAAPAPAQAVAQPAAAVAPAGDPATSYDADDDDGFEEELDDEDHEDEDSDDSQDSEDHDEEDDGEQEDD